MQQWVNAVNTLTVRGVQPSRGGVTLDVTYASNVYNGPGRYVFTVAGDRIQRIDMVPPQ